MPGVTGKSFVNVVLALVSVAVCACGNSSAPGSADVGRGNLTAAGATFPEPFYSRAFFAYSQSYPQVTVNYQAVGSGAGIEQFIKGTVDFGASDVPMGASDMASAGGPSTVGVAKSVQWPAGIGGKGNDGVAQAITQTSGAIGYVELAYVVQAKMHQASLKNKNGKFVQASVAGATAAAAQNANVSPTNFS